MQSRKKNNKEKFRSIKKTKQNLASKRIQELFVQADLFFSQNPKYSNNCVKLARKISLKNKVSFTKEQKILFCKKCQSYLKPSKTSRLRVSRGKIIVLCLNCKHISRYVYK